MIEIHIKVIRKIDSVHREGEEAPGLIKAEGKSG